MKIHAIGDSHIRSFKNNNTFIVYQNWAGTAFKLSEEGHKSILNILKILREEKIDKKNDILLLSFGEIDCRLHIYNVHKKDDIPINVLIDKTVVNYGEMITRVKELGFRVSIYNVPPSQNVLNRWNILYFAPLDIRVQIVKEFNKKLNIFCKENTVLFIDIYSKISDENGVVLPEYSKFPIKSRTDKTHLNKKIVPFVLKEICQKIKVKNQLGNLR